jgi:hypothetical protein
VDLHFARLQGVNCATQGWDTTCSQGQTHQDCWYLPSSGCEDLSNVPPGWGYQDSAQSACIGWSSRRRALGASGVNNGCTNPRLDRDTVTCNSTVSDPTDGNYCGPENINLDNPHDGDAFAIGVNHYANHGGTAVVHPHVNLYCNGERVLSAGYNPLTGQTQYPLLNVAGAATTGDWWTAAIVKAKVDTQGTLTACNVAIVPSHHTDPTRDGPSANPAPNDTAGACVDSTANLTPSPYQFSYTNHQFVENATLQGSAAGSLPASVAGWCKH